MEPLFNFFFLYLFVRECLEETGRLWVGKIWACGLCDLLWRLAEKSFQGQINELPSRFYARPWDAETKSEGPHHVVLGRPVRN